MHFSSFNHSVVLAFGNDEKLVAILVCSLFGQVAPSMLRRISVFIDIGSQVRRAVLEWGVNKESLRTQYSIAAQQKDRSVSQHTCEACS